MTCAEAYKIHDMKFFIHTACSFLLLTLVQINTLRAQDCPSMRALSPGESAFQEGVIRQLNDIFAKQGFPGYITDHSSPEYPPQVWREVCSDRQETEAFNLNGFYTWMTDPALPENEALLNSINTVDYSKGETALDQLRNIGNKLRLECEWGINTNHFPLKNIGNPISVKETGDYHLFILDNARKEDGKNGDVYPQTFIIYGKIKIKDELQEEEGKKIHVKLISPAQPSGSYRAKLNSYVRITGGKTQIHESLDISSLQNQLKTLIQQ